MVFASGGLLHHDTARRRSGAVRDNRTADVQSLPMATIIDHREPSRHGSPGNLS